MPKDTTNKGTQTIISHLETKEKNKSFYDRLLKYNLGSNPLMLKIITANPNYGNRLISLFKELKELNIALAANLESIINKNISSLGGAVNLLGLIKELGIRPDTISMELLFNAAKSDQTLMQSTRDLYQAGMLNLARFKLMLTYPEQSYKIAKLLIDLEKHALSDTTLVEKLSSSALSPQNRGTTIELLNLLLENNFYYPNVADILLEQEKNIDKIYEGTKKLLAENYLPGNYFELLKQNPQNANIFAKNILLLHNASLISNNPEDLLTVSKLDVGAFHFMKHLQQAGMLDARHYQKICRSNNVLNQEEVSQALSNLPLFAGFQPKELEEMLDLMDKPTISKNELQKIVKIINEHLIPNQNTNSSSTNGYI
jgi:hypothetical protein